MYWGQPKQAFEVNGQYEVLPYRQHRHKIGSPGRRKKCEVCANGLSATWDVIVADRAIPVCSDHLPVGYSGKGRYPSR
jgi:hypothetical protein